MPLSVSYHFAFRLTRLTAVASPCASQFSSETPRRDAISSGRRTTELGFGDGGLLSLECLLHKRGTSPSRSS